MVLAIDTDSTVYMQMMSLHRYTAKIFRNAQDIKKYYLSTCLWRSADKAPLGEY